jgi:hypothetical protein
MTLDLSTALGTALGTALERLIQNERPSLEAVSELTADIRPGGDSTWSPKEELGHLIDSAANNHIRFTRALIEPEFHGPTYAQNDWVTVHRYQEMPWTALVEFWYRYNHFIVGLLARVPKNKLQTLCFVGSDNGVSLEFLVGDYVLHMQHHLDHILGREHVTVYPAIAADH